MFLALYKVKFYRAGLQHSLSDPSFMSSCSHRFPLSSQIYSFILNNDNFFTQTSLFMSRFMALLQCAVHCTKVIVETFTNTLIQTTASLGSQTLHISEFFQELRVTGFAVTPTVFCCMFLYEFLSM